MNDLASDIGLLKRGFRDVHSVVSRLDRQMRRLVEPSANHATPNQLLAKLLTCHVIGRKNARPAAATAAELYANDPGLLVALARPGMIGKAASAPATTTAATWAGELGTPSVYDQGFLQLVAPASVYAQLSQRPGSIRVSLAGFSSVKVPSRAPSPSLSAPFIGESSAIPVRQLLLSNATLSPKKCAVISQFSETLLKHSTPDIEQLIRATMALDTANAIDGVLLDSNAVTAIRPAGLLFGVTPTSPAAGGGLAAFAADVRALALAIEATGPLIDPVLVMSSSSALLLDVLSQGGAGGMPVVFSPNVPAKALIMLDAACFASAEGDVPDISTSKEALLHEEQDSPLPISTVGTPNTIAAPTRSTFQTATLALRLLQDVSWTMTRTGRVASITTVTW